MAPFRYNQFLRMLLSQPGWGRPMPGPMSPPSVFQGGGLLPPMYSPPALPTRKDQLPPLGWANGPLGPNWKGPPQAR